MVSKWKILFQYSCLAKCRALSFKWRLMKSKWQIRPLKQFAIHLILRWNSLFTFSKTGYFIGKFRFRYFLYKGSHCPKHTQLFRGHEARLIRMPQYSEVFETFSLIFSKILMARYLSETHTTSTQTDIIISGQQKKNATFLWTLRSLTLW